MRAHPSFPVFVNKETCKKIKSYHRINLIFSRRIEEDAPFSHGLVPSYGPATIHTTYPPRPLREYIKDHAPGSDTVMISAKHRRKVSPSSSSQLAGHAGIVQETRELEHFCLMKLIASVSNMKTDIYKLYDGVESLQSRIDHQETSHDARMMELRTQINELRDRVQNKSSVGPVNPQRTASYLEPTAPLDLRMANGSVDEPSFSKIDTKSLVDDEPEPAVIQIQPEHDVKVLHNDFSDTSSHYSGISIPANWRKSNVAQAPLCDEGAPVPPASPLFSESLRASIIIPEIAHLHPRPSATNLRGSVSSYCGQVLKTAQTDFTELASKISRVSLMSQQQAPNLIPEEDEEEEENSGSEALVEAAPPYVEEQCVPVRPKRPYSCSSAEYLKPLSCGEPTSSFLTPQQLTLLGVETRDGFF